jgi:methylmalonyl-CoA mutase cobalamin-binding domain/chain
MDMLRDRGLAHVRVIVGGIIPEADSQKLAALGVAKVFTPGAGLTEIAEFVQRSVASRAEKS